MKKKLITILMSAAIVACLAGFVSCGKLSAPEQAHKNGNVVRVNYDTNGGIIGGGDNVTLFDMFNPHKYTADANGNVHIKVLDPVDERRENIGKSDSNKNPLTKSGNILVGWYKTRTENADGSYSYSDKWDFKTDSFEVKQNTTGEEFTLYALWTEFFEFDYYRVKSDGNVEFIGKDQLSVIPSEVKGTADETRAAIYLPAWADGAMNYQTGSYSFPKVSGMTYTAAYLDKECEKEIKTEQGKPFIHSGYIDENGVAQNRIQNIYVTYEEGERYKISTAEQFAKYANVDGYYEISGDLDFTDVAWPNSLTFGTFNGRIYGKDGISVKFSNISAKYSSSSSNRGGLFGEIGDNAVIENVAFENVTVEIAASGMVSDIKYGLFAGNVSEKADMTGVSLTGATLKISGEIEQPSGDYRIHLLANGAIDKIAADFETFGFEVYGQDIGGMYFYSFNPETVSVEADGSIKLTFVGFEEYGEKSYSIKERR